jgi:hypothetical protein
MTAMVGGCRFLFWALAITIVVLVVSPGYVGSNGRPKSDTIPNVQKRERHDLVVESAMISWLKRWGR